MAELGDRGRFEAPEAYLDAVSTKHSSGETVQRSGITKTGNGHVRRSWSGQLGPIACRLEKPAAFSIARKA